MPLSWKGRLVLALVGVVLWSQPGMSAKIERFTDKEGTVHISNAAEVEPSKPGWSPSPGRITPPPQQIFPEAPPGPVPQPQVVPSPVEPPKMPGDAANPMAEPPAAEAGGEPAQPAPAPPAQVAPGQQE